MSLYELFILVLGAGNFFMHRALLDSGRAEVMAFAAPLVRLGGPYVTYAIEFALLLGALALAGRHPLAGLLLYGVYTLGGVLSWAWLGGPGGRG